VPRMLRSTPLLRRGALLIRGLWLRDGNPGPGSAAQRQARCTASGTQRCCSPNGAVQAVVLKLDFRKSGARALAAPDGNEGVGEHVRTRFHFEL
jgi:hypothetical protein